MSLEKYYFKLPDSIKFNPKILKLSYNALDMLNRFRGVSPQDYLLNLASEDSETKDIRQKFRTLYVELLIFVDNVCNKYDIDYWLGTGTLLGAVRHNGFIPWDDDIDLVSLREDYNKLIEVLPKELAKYDLKEHCGLTLLLENQINYFNEFSSVCDAKDKNGNDLIEGKYNFLQVAWLRPFVKIDIFPLDYILDDELEDIHDKFPAIQYKFYYDMLNDNAKYFDELDKVRQEAGFTDSKTKQFSFTFECVPQWKMRIFDYDKTFPLSSIDFEGHNFKCPKDCNHHLTSMFGPNYMDFPKVIANHNTLELIDAQFASKEEMGEAFDEAIYFLKNVNEMFK